MDLRRNYKLRRDCPAGTLELLPFGTNSDLPWDWKFSEITSQGSLFDFAVTLELITFGANYDLCWNFPAGTLELITFGASSDLA